MLMVLHKIHGLKMVSASYAWAHLVGKNGSHQSEVRKVDRNAERTKVVLFITEHHDWWKRTMPVEIQNAVSLAPKDTVLQKDVEKLPSILPEPLKRFYKVFVDNKDKTAEEVVIEDDPEHPWGAFLKGVEITGESKAADDAARMTFNIMPPDELKKVKQEEKMKKVGGRTRKRNLAPLQLKPLKERVVVPEQDSDDDGSEDKDGDGKKYGARDKGSKRAAKQRTEEARAKKSKGSATRKEEDLLRDAGLATEDEQDPNFFGNGEEDKGKKTAGEEEKAPSPRPKRGANAPANGEQPAAAAAAATEPAATTPRRSGRASKDAKR